MNNTEQIESTLITVAQNHLKEAESYALCQNPSEATEELATAMGLSTEAFLRQEMVQSMERCLTIVDLASFDSGLSDHVKKQLLSIEKQAGKLSRPGKIPEDKIRN